MISALAIPRWPRRCANRARLERYVTEAEAGDRAALDICGSYLLLLGLGSPPDAAFRVSVRRNEGREGGDDA